MATIIFILISGRAYCRFLHQRSIVQQFIFHFQKLFRKLMVSLFQILILLRLKLRQLFFEHWYFFNGSDWLFLPVRGDFFAIFCCIDCFSHYFGRGDYGLTDEYLLALGGPDGILMHKFHVTGKLNTLVPVGILLDLKQ